METQFSFRYCLLTGKWNTKLLLVVRNRNVAFTTKNSCKAKLLKIRNLMSINLKIIFRNLDMELNTKQRKKNT